MEEQEQPKMEWRKEKLGMLIDLYHEKEVLWNPTHKDFKNRNKKHDAWAEIAESVETDVEEVERKARSLVGQFQRELRKGKSGDGAEAFYKSKWIYFKSLLFLQDKNTQRHQEEVGIEDTQITENLHHSNETQQTQDSDNQFDDTAQPPKRSKNKKRNDGMAKESYEVINKLRGGMKKRDEFDVFGEYVAHCLRNVKSKHLILDAKFQINNILYHTEKNDQRVMTPFASPGSNSILGSSSTSYASSTTPFENENELQSIQSLSSLTDL